MLLLPVAMLLVIALSVASLVILREGVEQVIEERRVEARVLAVRLAGLLAGGQVETFEGLRQHLRQDARLALVAQAGSSRGSFGLFERPDLLQPAAGRDLASAFAVGPGPPVSGWVVAFAPVEWRGARHVLRVDLPAGSLAGQRTSASILFWVVLVADLAAAALVILFLRNLLGPYDAMLARARQVRPAGDGTGDEIAYLLGTFEQAMGALAHPQAGSARSDLLALQRTLGTSFESGLLLLDDQGDVLSLNDLGQRLLGVGAPEAGASIEEALSGHQQMAEVLREAVSKGQTVQRRELSVQSDEGERTLGLTVHPLRREDRRVRAFLVLFADLTEVRRAREEQRLSATLAQVGELSAGLAHEMRNSLATFSGYLALIRRAEDPAAVGECVDELERESAHVRRVLEDYLSFARPGSTRMEEIDLERVARRAAADPALAAASIRFDRRGDGPLRVRGDSQLLERAVRNLLHNAVDAQARARRPDPIEVCLDAGNGTPVLTVADRGDGVSEQVRARLFQPFVSSTNEGVGLGLALARRIVELHGARLLLEDREGGGTVAEIRFGSGQSVT